MGHSNWERLVVLQLQGGCDLKPSVSGPYDLVQYLNDERTQLLKLKLSKNSFQA